MKRWIGLGLLALATSVLAEDKPGAMPPAPPEVQKTVDAFAGRWTIKGTLAVPGATAPAPATLTIECKQTALGKAVVCTWNGEATGMGPLEAGGLVGYDPVDKVVHFMAITSDGEFHDHKGTWKDDKSLVFEPLKYNSAMGPATEDLRLSFAAANQMSFNSVTTMADGSKVTFEGSGTR